MKDEKKCDDINSVKGLIEKNAETFPINSETLSKGFGGRLAKLKKVYIM